MRSTFWPNRIFERQSSQNRHTGLKFSPNRENRALFIKLVHSALFRSCGTRFGQIAFVSVKVLKIVKLAQNSLQNGNSLQTGKTVRFHRFTTIFKKNSTKRSFQVMRSTFWPNRIFERQSSQNRQTGWNSLQNGKTVRFYMKIVQNALFRSCGARFGQIAFVSVKVLKIVTLAWNSLQNGKTVRFPWKLYKTLFSGHAQHVLAKSHFWASKFSKSQNWPEILFKRENSALSENCTKRSFQVMRSTFWPNRIFERQSSQNRKTGLKFSWKRENSALSMKIVQNALFRSCAARFGQIALLSVKVLKIVKLAWNSLQNGKTVRFPWKLYRSCGARFKLHLWAWKFSKSSHWPEILAETGKQCALDENCTKGSFQVMRSTFWPNRIFERQSSQNRQTGLKFSPNRENSALLITIVQNALFRSCAARFGQIAFLTVKVLKIAKLGWNSLQDG